MMVWLPGYESTNAARAVEADIDTAREWNPPAQVGNHERMTQGGIPDMKLKNIAGVLAALVFAFAVVACNDDGGDATEAPAASPAASEAAA